MTMRTTGQQHDQNRKRHLILGTAGHIDHGKSSLVKALTGVDPDRLIEEKRRGITIELGFARLDLPDGTGMGVVDVPGHERFVRQMIAGSTGIDIALLCVAADDGVMPQTREHLAVLEVLDVRNCVVVLTKRDLVDNPWLEFIKEELHGFLADTVFAAAPVIAVSSRTGEGLKELRETIIAVARDSTGTRSGSDIRLPVDRVFSIKGAGTVVTGTLWSGEVRPDIELELLSGGGRARVRSVQVHGERVEVASAGSRVALNLSTLKVGDISPGDFLATPGGIAPTDRFDAWFTYLDTAGSGKPLLSGTRVHVAHGTREIRGRVLLMDGLTRLAPNGSGYAQLRLEESLPVSWQDRFVVRLYSPTHVAGGGMVLHCRPRRRTNLAAGEDAQLAALRDADAASAMTAVFPTLAAPMTAEGIAAVVGVGVGAAGKALSALVASGQALRIGDDLRAPFYAPGSVVQKALSTIETTLLGFHAANPTQAGVSRAALQRLCQAKGLRGTGEAAFQALLDAARVEGRLSVHEGLLSHPTADGKARERDEQTAERLFGLLAEAGTTPPSTPELIAIAGLDGPSAHRALGILRKQGRIRYINKDLCFTTAALSGLEEKVREYLLANGSAGVAELKDAMATSRKYAVPLLEYLDTHGVTKREGDSRGLRRREGQTGKSTSPIMGSREDG